VQGAVAVLVLRSGFPRATVLRHRKL